MSDVIVARIHPSVHATVQVDGRRAVEQRRIRRGERSVPLCIGDLTPDSIEDAVAYWLYAEDEGWELWRLVPGSPTLSPNGQALRLGFELEGDRFELVLIERGPRLFAKFDDREDPEQELPARAFDSSGELVVTFTDKDQTVFVLLELTA